MRCWRMGAVFWAVWAGASGCLPADQPAVQEAEQALRKAASFFHSQVATHGHLHPERAGALRIPCRRVVAGCREGT